MRFAVSGPALLLALLTSCADPTSPLQEVHIRVTVNPKAKGMEPDVIYRVENRSGRPVFVTRCRNKVMAALDRYVEEEWRPYPADTCEADLYLNQLRLEPGDTVGGTLRIHNNGQWRVRVGLASSPGAKVWWSGFSEDFLLP